MDRETVIKNMLGWMASELNATQDENFFDDLKEENKDKCLKLKSIQNARQLGGYVNKEGKTVKKDVLLRTANLNNVSAEDLNTLEKKYNLKLIIDLRSSMEHLNFPDMVVNGAKNVWANLVENTMDEMVEKYGNKFAPLFKKCKTYDDMTYTLVSNPLLQGHLGSNYLDMVKAPDTKIELTHALKEIVSMNGEAVLWHCTQGKDRCGLISVLMLGVLGVDDETILNDFDVSNDYYKKFIEKRVSFVKERGGNDKAILTLISMLGVSRKAMEDAVNYMNKKCGSILNFIEKELNITKEEINKLQEFYLV